jgi:phosphatidylethanolamine/phosphatidyl-N-methylethanolamine N-methyltransferase
VDKLNECVIDVAPPVIAAALTADDATAPAFGDEGLFFRAWLNEPVTIGAVMPTREPLARAMSAAVLRTAGARAGKWIVELGGGTGPLTRALEMAAPDPDTIAIVERNPVFHRLLTRRFPKLQVILGDAESLAAVLRDHAVGPIGAVVSSLPRVGWPLARQHSILKQCFDLMGAEGEFLEFSYGPFSPVPRRLIRELGLTASRLCRVWRNLPPASIWSYRRKD